MDQPSPPTYRPDWYPDPTGRFEFRYHNGQSWTGDVSVDGNRYLDPLQPQPYAPLPVLHQKSGSGKAVAGLVLGILSVAFGWVPFLAVAAIAGAVLAFLFGVGVLRRDRVLAATGLPTSRRRGMAIAATILSPFGLASSGIGIWLTIVTIREVNEFTNVGRYSAEITGCAIDDGVATASGTITNLEDSTKTYHLTIEFQRPDSDSRLGIESTDVDDVAAGATAEWSVFAVLDEVNVDCTINDVTGPLPFGQS